MPQAQRPLALGLKDILIRVLGAVPGPIVFGIIFDQSCRYWQQSHVTGSDSDDATGTGSCALYDNEAVSFWFMTVCISAKLVAILFFSLANWFYKPPVKAQQDSIGNGTVASDNQKVRFIETDDAEITRTV